MLARRLFVISGFALLIFAGVIILDAAKPLAYLRLGNLFRDAISRTGKKTPADPNLVFLAIDTASVNLDETDINQLFGLTSENPEEMRALRLMSHRFPWPREVYALVLDRLVRAGARVVIFDLNFPGPADDDPVFKAALDRYSDQVVIGSNFVGGTLTRPSETLVRQTAPIDDRIGFTNFWADEDDIVRRARYGVTFDLVRETRRTSNSEIFPSIAAAALTKAGFGHDVPSDLESHALRFTAPPRAGFPPHSLFEIFVPAYWRQNYRSGDVFRDKIVIIGAEGNWQHDEHETPFGPMPGAEIHLNAINAALHDAFVTDLPHGAGILLTVLAALIAIALSVSRVPPWWCVPVLVGLNAVGVWLAILLFNHASIYLSLVPFLIELNATALVGLVADFTVERLDKSRLRRTLERYVSKDIVVEMLDKPAAYQESLGGSIKPVTILFSDIRGYSLISTRSNPHEVVNQLNEYFGAMVECVFRFGGTLDKFIGDAVMAVWGNIHTQGVARDARNAVQAALAMQKELATLNGRWLARGWPQLRTGIAIHHGEVVVGNVGSPQRMEFTAIGDAVNVTWKLQELTKQLGCDFIVSEYVQKAIDSSITLRSLGFVDLPGVNGSFEIFSSGDSTNAVVLDRPTEELGGHIQLTQSLPNP